MALQKDWTNPITQITATGAYIRVVAINVDCVAMVIDLVVGIYPTADAFSMPGVQPFDTYHAWPDYVEFLGMPIDVRTASYEYLKTLVPFSGAVDV